MMDALVSGPRTVTMAESASRVTTNSRWQAATDTNGPPPLLRARHTRSMYGESEGRSAKRRNIQRTRS
jgi:hypothetical protein